MKRSASPKKEMKRRAKKAKLEAQNEANKEAVNDMETNNAFPIKHESLTLAAAKNKS